MPRQQIIAVPLQQVHSEEISAAWMPGATVIRHGCSIADGSIRRNARWLLRPTWAAGAGKGRGDYPGHFHAGESGDPGAVERSREISLRQMEKSRRNFRRLFYRRRRADNQGKTAVVDNIDKSCRKRPLTLNMIWKPHEKLGIPTENPLGWG
jgi:hypothetical protein